MRSGLRDDGRAGYDPHAQAYEKLDARGGAHH